jgi:hypothetical protein
MNKSCATKKHIHSPRSLPKDITGGYSLHTLNFEEMIHPCGKTHHVEYTVAVRRKVREVELPRAPEGGGAKSGWQNIFSSFVSLSDHEIKRIRKDRGNIKEMKGGRK